MDNIIVFSLTSSKKLTAQICDILGIEEGKIADLIILDKNPLTVPIDEVKNIKVLETIKEGIVVFKRE